MSGPVVPGADPAYAITPERSLPKQAEVVVVGGGVVGVTAALTLAQQGIPVVLLEKGRIAGEQSSRNWGWIRNQRRDIREIPLMLAAQNLWRRYGAQADRDFGLKEKGIAYLALTEDEMAAHAAWLDEAQGFQLHSRLLTSSEAGALIGQDGRRFAGGIFTPTDLHAEPGLAVPVLARLAASAGAAVFERCAVRALDLEGGHVRGVLTEHGRIATERVIYAGGAWSRTFLENMGLSLPQLAIRSQAFRTAPVDVVTSGPVGTSLGSIRPRADGGVTIGRSHSGQFEIIPAAFRHFRAFAPHAWAHRKTLKLRFGREFFGALGRHRWAPDQFSPFEAARVLDPAPVAGVVQGIHRSAQEIFPQLRGVPVLGAWGGMIDVTPDEVPVIGPMAGLPGFFLATGMSGHGFGLGPGAGHLAADLAIGATPIVDPRAFSPARFERS